jgi:hypothetical protein
MMAKTLRMFRTTILILVAAALLSACYAKFQILSPTADAVVSPSSAIHIVLSGRQVSDLTLNIDGNDFTSRIVLDPNTGNYVADLPLAVGMHTINASALAYCSYCSGQVYLASDHKMVCAAGGTPPFTTKTLSAQDGGMGWSSTGLRTVALAVNDGTTKTQWEMYPIGLQGFGIIYSREFYPCTCLRSPDDTNKAAVELAPCNVNDPRQQWEATRMQQQGLTGLFRFRNNGTSASTDVCLAEGHATDNTAGKLVQDSCTDAADRLWKVYRIDNGRFESNTPWEQ